MKIYVECIVRVKKELRSIKVLEIREFEVGKYSEAREIRKEKQIINKSSD